MEKAPPILAIDASIVVKWFVSEPDSDKAVRLRNAHVEGTTTLFAPDLLVYEVANALRYKPDLSAEDLESCVESLFALDLELIMPSSSLIATAVRSSRQRGITAYDGIYLSIAEAIGSYLVTADRSLHDRVKRTGLAWLLRELDKTWTV
jgi:predicted nucleic acid-binding protein